MPETGGRPVPRGRGGYLRRRLALSSKYTLPSRLIHWLTAIGFLFMWVSGFTIGNVVEEDTLLESLLFYLHVSFAITFGALLVRRIGVGLTQGVPSLPAEIRPIERTGAHLADAALNMPGPGKRQGGSGPLISRRGMATHQSARRPRASHGRTEKRST